MINDHHTGQRMVGRENHLQVKMMTDVAKQSSSNRPTSTGSGRKAPSRIYGTRTRICKRWKRKCSEKEEPAISIAGSNRFICYNLSLPGSHLIILGLYQ